MASQDRQKTALVTGISGFTGRYVKEQLEANGYEVFGSILENSSNDHEIVAALSNREAVNELISVVQPTAVVHLAAISSVTHGDVQEMYEVNIIGTRNLLDSLSKLNTKPESVVLASSANIYGNSLAENIAESEPLKPENDYSVSKLAMEEMSKLWASKLPITITRPFNYTGVGQSTKFLIPKIVEHFKRRATVIELGNIDVFRDFSDVRTVAWAYSQLATNPQPNEVFNISSGQLVSISEVISTLEELTGHQIEVRVNPEFVRDHEVKRLGGDSSKLWDRIGTPPKITLKETLGWMLEN